MSPDHSVSDLRVCAFCGYGLAGLPVEHRCPECGRAFDEYSMVIRLKRSRGLGATLASALVLAVAVGWLTYVVTRGDWAFAVAAGAVMGFIYLAEQWIRAEPWERGAVAFVLNRSGLHFGPIDSPRVSLTWYEIGDVTYNPWFGWLRIRGLRGRSLLKLTVQELGSTRLALSCVREIKRAKRVYGTSPS